MKCECKLSSPIKSFTPDKVIYLFINFFFYEWTQLATTPIISLI